jgi:VWFA-related protein
LNVTWPKAALAVILLAVLPTNSSSAAQESKPPAQPAEMASSETTFKIRAERNLVVVRVVVRDRNGEAVTGLRKEDFRLFDNGKAQTIAEFSVESVGAKPTPATPAPAPSAPAAAPPAAETEHPLVMPDRFVALYFDDVHLPFEDVAYTRDAAKKYLSDSLQPGDRASIFTASGRLSQDFTADRDKLRQALDRLQPHPITGGVGRQCPDISPYQAFQIVDHQDADAIRLGVVDVLYCQCGGDPRACSGAEQIVQAAAMQVLESDETQSRYTLRELENLVRHLAAMPGQRSIVLVSPGFLSERIRYELGQIADRALRARVVINSLDSRGLYTFIPGGDASTQGGPVDVQYTVLKSTFDRASVQVSADALAELAAETGGIFFQNSNDYNAGFRRTGGLPETSYVLTFSPQSLKIDGSFHKLKVTLANPSGLTLQARRGYYAPRQSEDAAARAKDEIEEMMFSRDEMRELPVDVNTSFFKTDNLNAKLSVVAHVDVSSIHFRKEQDRSLDNVTLVAALFDSDGNYVTGTQTRIEMHLRDATMTRVERTGVFLKAGLDVKVGTYFMRVVVRDSESTRIATLNRTVEIPY